MKKGDHLYQQYVNILKEELRPAMGCTESIALAYAGAMAWQILGRLPEKVTLLVSGTICDSAKASALQKVPLRWTRVFGLPYVSGNPAVLRR